MPTRHRCRCCLADRVSAHGLMMTNRCERCCSRDAVCRVDLSSGRCSECIRAARTCSLARGEVEHLCILSLSWCFSFDISLDRRIVVEQERLRSAARKAEQDASDALQAAAEASSRAARLRKQLDFLEGRDRRVLQSELECLELLDHTGAQVPEPASATSPSSFSDVLGGFDWSAVESLDIVGGNS